MTPHRFTLKPYKRPADRLQCPACCKKHCFAPYIDTETGQEVAAHVGRCDREVNCGYHFKPRDFFAQNPAALANYTDPAAPAAWAVQMHQHNAKRAPLPPPSLHPESLVHASKNGYEDNCFIQFLLSRHFSWAQLRTAIALYQIGSSKHWPGATVFWQIASKEGTVEVRGGKIMLYNPETGKRVKEPQAHITWVHRALNLEDFNLQQSFFGEHLLTQFPFAPVCIVESEKTAIIASIYMPEAIWIACGSLQSIKLSRCLMLKGRKVTLYPDLGGFDIWTQKAEPLRNLCAVTVSRRLEEIATPEEREQGLDIADYLLRIDPRTLPGYDERPAGSTGPAAPADPQSSGQDTRHHLRELLKWQFLREDRCLLAAGMREIMLRYKPKGLRLSDAKAVLQDLIQNHGFTIDYSK
jgi:hypothetical protein